MTTPSPVAPETGPVALATPTSVLTTPSPSPVVVMNNARPGTPYSYDIAARFKGNRGTGKRIGPRVGTFDFIKK